jgi:HSP20 family molecular chaperone IbpA
MVHQVENTTHSTDGVFVGDFVPGQWTTGDGPYNTPGTVVSPPPPHSPSALPGQWLPLPGKVDYEDFDPAKIEVRWLPAPKDDDSPDADVYVDSNGDYHCDVLVAGYRRDQVEVVSEGNVVRVILHENSPDDFVGDETDDNDYEVREIPHGERWAEFEIPGKYVVDDLEARRYDDGILRMTFKKKEAKRHGIA